MNQRTDEDIKAVINRFSDNTLLDKAQLKEIASQLLKDKIKDSIYQIIRDYSLTDLVNLIYLIDNPKVIDEPALVQPEKGSKKNGKKTTQGSQSFIP